MGKAPTESPPPTGGGKLVVRGRERGRSHGPSGRAGARVVRGEERTWEPAAGGVQGPDAPPGRAGCRPRSDRNGRSLAA